jgi:hypothetical protein
MFMIELVPQSATAFDLRGIVASRLKDCVGQLPLHPNMRVNVLRINSKGSVQFMQGLRGRPT